MPLNKRCIGEGDELVSPTDYLVENKSKPLGNSFKKLINVSDASDEELDVSSGGKEREKCSMCLVDTNTATIDPNDDSAPTYVLNPVQEATISLLKAGLDQISWEPLIGLLEDLAATGTVSRIKLHDCATKVIKKILGADLESQVLHQFHSDPSKGEIILIESLIYSYVLELAEKKNSESRNKLSAKKYFEKSIKRKPVSRSKKSTQPSYQKTTESFRRKQKSKRIKKPQRHSQKRHLHQLIRHENSVPDKNSLYLNQLGSAGYNMFKCSNRSDPNSNCDQISNNYPWGETSERKSKQQSTPPVNEKHQQTPSRRDNKTKRKGKGKIEDGWDQVETETAIKTYEINNALIKKPVGTEKLPETIKNPIYSIEFTPSKKCMSDFEENLNNCLAISAYASSSRREESTHYTHCSLCNNRLSESEQETHHFKKSSILFQTPNWLEEFFQDQMYTPEKDNNNNKIDDLSKITSNNVTITEQENTPGNNDLEPVALSSKSKIDEENFSLNFQNKPIVGTLLESSSNQCNIIKVNAEKECHSLCNKSTITEFEDLYDNKPVIRELSPICTSVVRKCQSRDNLISLRISEELMEILKEQLISRKRCENLMLGYQHVHEEPPLPLSDLEKLRSENSAIMKRLNLISYLSWLLLITSFFTSSIFIISTDYIQRTLIDFFSGWYQWLKASVLWE